MPETGRETRYARRAAASVPTPSSLTRRSRNRTKGLEPFRTSFWPANTGSNAISSKQPASNFRNVKPEILIVKGKIRGGGLAAPLHVVKPLVGAVQ